MHASMADHARHDAAASAAPAPPTPLGAVLAFSALASLGTGIFWNVSAFIAKQTYGFSEQRTIVLYVIMGVVYSVCALNAARVTRAVSRWLSTRGLLCTVALAQTTVSLLPVALRAQWALWF